VANGKEPKIQQLIATFTSASSALQIYFQQQRPLTPLQLKSISLCTSMIQFYLEKTLNKRRGKNMNSSAAAIWDD
jgi:hypothetical protein